MDLLYKYIIKVSLTNLYEHFVTVFPRGLVVRLYLPWKDASPVKSERI